METDELNLKLELCRFTLTQKLLDSWGMTAKELAAQISNSLGGVGVSVLIKNEEKNNGNS